MSWIDKIFSNIDDTQSPLWDESEKCLVPLIEIKASEDEVAVSVDLPFVKDKEDISLEVSDNALEIKALLYQSVAWERWGTIHKDLRFDTFKKTIHFPETVDPTKVKARFVNGILTINIPIIRHKYKIHIE